MQLDRYAGKEKVVSLKKVVDFLSDEHIVLLALDEIDLKFLKSRKKIRLFSGLTQKKYYVSLFFIKQKSRFLVKNANEIIDLEKRLEEYKNHAYKIKYLFISSPMCSKAKSFLRDNRWKIVEVKDDTL